MKTKNSLWPDRSSDDLAVTDARASFVACACRFLSMGFFLKVSPRVLWAAVAMMWIPVAPAQPLTRVAATTLQLGTGAGPGGVVFPATLSATGAFADLITLAPSSGVVGYEPTMSFWTDHARKRRWFALPDVTSTFGFSANGNWTLPPGAVWIKHFDLELTRGDPTSARRIETRFVVKTAGGLQRFTYAWNDAQTEANLVPPQGTNQVFTVMQNGVAHRQTWRFPSRAECITCHSTAAGSALSFNTRHLNHEQNFSGQAANYIVALAAAGYLSGTPAFEPPDARGTLPGLPRLARADDPFASLEHRARSYLDSNCSFCHQPGGDAVALFDARISTPFDLAGIINGPLLDSGGDPRNRVIVPGDATHSRVLQRIAVRGPDQMPPLASFERDLAGETLLREWISALADSSALPPPSRLANLAARARTGSGDNALITGFVVGPGAGKTVLLRAIGPALAAAPFNLGGTLADPGLTLLGPDSATRIVAHNDNWLAADASTFAAVGAFGLPAGSRDAAMIVRLEPGAYTAQVTATGDPAGLALIEVYDADPVSSATTNSRLINLSVRGHVGTGAEILIPGIVVGDGAAKTMLIRAVGPTLGASPFNVAGVLAQPTVTLFRGSQVVASNTAWNSASNAADIRAAARIVGAFPLGEGSRDSALLVPLSPGAYTLHISGAADTTGVVLAEVYELR